MESGYQPHVTSWAGAWGVMQVTPGAWLFVEDVLLGRPVARTAKGNIQVGVAYLQHLLHVFGGDERLALGAYYQGTRSVRLHGLFSETRAQDESLSRPLPPSSRAHGATRFAVRAFRPFEPQPTSTSTRSHSSLKS